MADVVEPMTVTKDRAHRAWRNAEHIKQLSDNLIKLGPWGIGVDGFLAWVPGAGTIYSVGSGALLLYEGFQAEASAWTLSRMAAYLVANAVMSDVPVVGWAMDTLFRGQLMAANALQKDIAARFGEAETVVDAPWWRAVVRPAPQR
ncbi:MAG TPA: DUF4112 domain-containing protein [Phenylobacterium sp.]|jgi:hypothetical protein